MAQQDFNLNHVHFPVPDAITEICPICGRVLVWNDFKKRYICKCGLIDLFKKPRKYAIITFGGDISHD